MEKKCCGNCAYFYFPEDYDLGTCENEEAKISSKHSKLKSTKACKWYEEA